MIGTTLGHFRIEAPLGSGGMGEVWLAHDLRLDRRVAIKFMNARLAADPQARRRFVREARALAAVEHPYVGGVFAVEDDAERPYLVLAYVEGRPLSALLESGPLPASRARTLVQRIAEGLAAVHARGIVHRDLKSDNVLVTADDTPRIVDFGIALSAGDTRFTETGLSPGTPGYTAPEVLKGGPADARADLFALGVIAHQMLTGSLPFPQTHPMAAMNAILNDPAPPFPSGLPHESLMLEPLVKRLLEKDPARRFQSAKEVAEAWGGQRVVTATTLELPVARRRPWRAIAAGGVVAIVAIGALLWPRVWTESAGSSRAALQRSVAVLEFENLSGDVSLDWMRRGIPELLGTALVQSESLDVFDSQRLASLEATSGPAGAGPPVTLESLRKHGIRRAIAGSFLRSGDHLRLQGRLLDVSSGRTLHARAVDGSVGGDLFELVGRLIPALQVALEVNLTGDREAEAWLREITTNSADAYRFYLQGHQALIASRWADADRLLGRAVELDSQFVLARADQMGARWNLGDVRGLAESRAALERLRDRVDERSRVQIDVIQAIVDRNGKQLIRSVSELRRLYPENRHYTYLLGRGFFTDSQYVRCLETLAPLRAQRYEWAWTYVLMAQSFERLGKPDSAAATYQLGYEVTHKDPELAYVYALFLGEHGQKERERALLEETLKDPRMIESPGSLSQVWLELAKLSYESGDAPRADSEIARALEVAPPGSEERSMVEKWAASRRRR